jgi:hypothetical protein
MNSDRVRLRDVTLADADLVDSWESPAIRGEFNDFGNPPGPMPRDVLAAGPLRNDHNGLLLVVLVADGNPIGTGASFTSGATEAWISDETGNVETGRIYMRGAQLGWLAGGPGIIASVPLAALWGLKAPILAGGVGYLVTAESTRRRTSARPGHCWCWTWC